MIVPAVGTQDSRITSDLLLPKQPSKKTEETTLASKSPGAVKKARRDPLIMRAEISQQWIRMLEHRARC